LDAQQNSYLQSTIKSAYSTGYDPVTCSRKYQLTRDRRDECEIGEMRENALKKIDVAACVRKGGYIDGAGLFGLPFCKFDYSDGGKLCSDDSDCQGKCTIEYGRTPEQTKPRCTYDNSWDGCYSEVVKGEVQPAICYD
jgi:hypothetical protein